MRRQISSSRTTCGASHAPIARPRGWIGPGACCSKRPAKAALTPRWCAPCSRHDRRRASPRRVAKGLSDREVEVLRLSGSVISSRIDGAQIPSPARDGGDDESTVGLLVDFEQRQSIGVGLTKCKVLPARRAVLARGWQVALPAGKRDSADEEGHPIAPRCPYGPRSAASASSIASTRNASSSFGRRCSSRRMATGSRESPSAWIAASRTSAAGSSRARANATRRTSRVPSSR